MQANLPTALSVLVLLCALFLCFSSELLFCFQVNMSSDNIDLYNNPFVALFGSVSEVELYKTSVEDATKSGSYAMHLTLLNHSEWLIFLSVISVTYIEHLHSSCFNKHVYSP